MGDIPAGWATVLVGVIGASSTLLALVLTWLGTLNKRLRKLERRDRLSWLYIRSLINHAYVHNALPLPDPPEGWLEDTE